MNRSHPHDASPDRLATEHADRADRSWLSRRGFATILVALTLLYLVPIGAHRYFPTTDGPSHLANAWVLHNWFAEPGSYQDTYELNLVPFPNWFSHVTLALLMFVAPPLIAEKILLTGYVLLFVLSMLYLLGGATSRRALHVLLALPFIYGYPLLMGFYNFVISVPLAFFVIGYWWRRRESPLGIGLAVRMNLLLLLLYFCHLMSLLLALGSILVLAAVRYRGRIGPTARVALVLTPCGVLSVWYVLAFGVVTSGPPGSTGWRALFGIEALVSYDPLTYRVAVAIAVLHGILFVHTLVRERLPAFRRSPRLVPRDGFLLLAVAFCLLYFIVPPNMAGGGMIHQRIGLFPFLVILPWLSPRYPRWGPPAVGLTAAALAAIHLVITMAPFGAVNRVLDDYTSGIPFVEKNATLLPARLPDEVIPGSRIRPIWHATGYYEAATGALGLTNYEAVTGYFPLRYKTGRDPAVFIREVDSGPAKMQLSAYPIPVDYVLLWYPGRFLPDLPRLVEDHPELRWTLEHYRLVHRKGSLCLLRRKEGPWPPR